MTTEDALCFLCRKKKKEAKDRERKAMTIEDAISILCERKKEEEEKKGKGEAVPVPKTPPYPPPSCTTRGKSKPEAKAKARPKVCDPQVKAMPKYTPVQPARSAVPLGVVRRIATNLN